MNKKVFVGLSGGVDSSVAALLLKQQGYDVTGVNMSLIPDDDGSAARDAQNVAECLGIPFKIYDLKDIFAKKVINYFIDEYINGKTPNPCVTCNENIKFGKLLELALNDGADFLATGHYADIEEKDGRFLLKRVHSKKDQSYFLNRLNQYQLSHIIFPIGDITKDQTREIALKNNIPVALKSDSQEVCFIKDNDYVRFIEKYCDFKNVQGDFLDTAGNIIGTHKGIINYTVGQRKGLGVTFGRPMYVTKIDSQNNSVTLGEEGSQYSDELIARDMNYIAVDKLDRQIEACVKIRCQAILAKAKIIPIENNSVKIIFEEPQRAVTPGQAAVIYDGDYVLGGGIIC